MLNMAPETGRGLGSKLKEREYQSTSLDVTLFEHCEDPRSPEWLRKLQNPLKKEEDIALLAPQISKAAKARHIRLVYLWFPSDPNI